MPNKVQWNEATAITFGDSGQSYTATFNALASAGMRQTPKASLGDPRPRQYAVLLLTQFGTAPTAGRTLELYWSSSNNATAGTNNDGQCSGTDAAYSIGADGLKQLVPVGTLVVDNAAADTNQQASFLFIPPTQYGQFVLYNNTDQALDNESNDTLIIMIPLDDEVQ